MRLALTATALLTVLCNAPAQAAPLAPSGKWAVAFDEAQCVATRNYGTDKKPLLLVFKQPPAGEVMQVGVIRNAGVNRKYSEQVEGRIRIDDGPAIVSSLIKFTVKSRRERVLLTNMPLAQFAAVRTGRLLSFSAQPEISETFQLADVEPLLKVMDTCVADLIKVWGGGESGLRQSAEGNIQGLMRADDYPASAIQQMKGGTVAFVMLVNEEGRVADCTVVQTSGVAALDAQSCAIMVERARFKPGIGMDGKPAKSIFKQRVTWRIE
jgi:TonB family protein